MSILPPQNAFWRLKLLVVLKTPPPHDYPDISEPVKGRVKYNVKSVEVMTGCISV